MRKLRLHGAVCSKASGGHLSGTDTLTTLESEITAAGHQLERTYQGKVADTPGPDDRGWIVHVDGELVATGGSVGRVEAGLRDWWEGSAPRGNTDAGG